MEMNKQESIEKILTWVGVVSDFDLMAMSESIRSGRYSFSGSLQKYELSNCLREAVTTYLDGEFDACFVKLKEFLSLLVTNYTHDSTVEGIRAYANMLNGAAERIEICDVFIEQWKYDAEAELSNAFPMFNGKISLDAYDCLQIERSIDNRYFHLYKYINGGELPRTTRYKISNGVLASDNIYNLITETGLDKTWGVTIGLYLEKKIDLSFFVITFSLNGNVYVLTDRIKYKNPDQIDRLRDGGRRFSEDRERQLDFLPYILIDKVIEKRQDTKDLSTMKGNEIWTFPLEDYFRENLYYLIKYTIEKITDGYDVKCLMSADSRTKLLTEGRVDMTDDSHFDETNMDILNQIVDEIYGGSSTALVVPNRQLIEQMGVSTQLMTIDELETNTQYLAHKQVAEMHEREKWGEAYDKDGDGMSDYRIYDEQRKQLLSMFKDKKSELERYLFAGTCVSIHDIDHPELYSGFNSNKSPRYKERFVSKYYEVGSLVTYDRNNRYNITCLSGDGNSVKNEFFRSVTFLRYTEIATILGISRSELPPLFRDFLAHNTLPYTGNQILNNVKPEFTAIRIDYASKNNANGFVVTFPYCGHCHRRLYKKYKIAETAVVVISSKQNKVIEILPEEHFKTKYNC